MRGKYIFNKIITFLVFFTILLFLAAIYISNTIAQFSPAQLQAPPQYIDYGIQTSPAVWGGGWGGLFAGYNTNYIGPGTSFSYSDYGGGTFPTLSTASCPGTQTPSGGGGTSVFTGLFCPSITGLACPGYQTPSGGGGTSFICPTAFICPGIGTPAPSGGGGTGLAFFGNIVPYPDNFISLNSGGTPPPIGSRSISSLLGYSSPTSPTCTSTDCYNTSPSSTPAF